MGYTLAVIRQESSFRSDALAPRGERQWFGIIEGKRLSSAAGYSQALDGTWTQYQKETGHWSASRNNFRDSSDFIGWYYRTNGQRLGISQYDYRAHYIVYHEGPTGYQNGSWRTKASLIDIAEKVAAQAKRYESQIRGCGILKPEKLLGLF